MIRNWIDRLSARSRWQLHLLVISIPLLLGLGASIGRTARIEPGALLYFLGHELRELTIFGGFFALAFLISDVVAAELGLRPARLGRMLLTGLGLGAALALVFGGLLWLFDRCHGSVLGTGTSTAEEFVLLAGHPVAFAFRYGLDACLTSGLEELYRAGLFAALFALYPSLSRHRWGGFVAIALGAFLLAFLQYYRGLHDMIPAFVLGLFLGGILLYRRSLVEAAIAHLVVRLVLAAMAYQAFTAAPPSSGNLADCAWYGSLLGVRTLIAQGAKANQRTTLKAEEWEDMPALEAATLAKGNGDEIIALLLAHGADVDGRDPHGRTALMTAAAFGHLEQVRLLLAHRADPRLVDENGYTALFVATTSHQLAIVDLIKERLKDWPPAK